MSQSLAQQIRDILRIDLAGRKEVEHCEIALRLDFITRKEKQKMYSTLRDFIKRGEIERVRPGVVRYLWNKKREVHPAVKTRCMNRFIRANRRESISADDLVANCGATMRTAKEHLQLLVRNEIMRRIDMPGNQLAKYRMVNDPGPNMIKNEERAARLRRIRAVKKRALEELDSAADAIARARIALRSMDEAGEKEAADADE